MAEPDPGKESAPPRARGALPTPRTLAAARMLAGMTQAELARSAGVHENIIQRYEAEETDARTRTLEKFVTALEKVGVVFLAETDTHVMGVAVTKKAEDPISTTKSEEN